jgi:hypothetical protein
MQNSILQWFAGKFLDRKLSPRELLTARKWVYGALILLLFTGSFFWRHYLVEAQEKELALREESRGELELSGSVLRLTLTGFRGLATCGLWVNAMETQKKNQWTELEFQVRWLTRLQPHFITPWLFQSWNLAYNVSVESDRISDKFFYITRGILLIAEGERMNHDNPDMRFSLGFYTQHKICNSDETNVHRSLFQLSCIPPNERDPARFRVQSKEPGGVPTFNWVEFEKFCKEHPRLVRRLRDGLRRETRMEQERQFTCERAEDVVQFLAENWRLPSLYQEGPATTENAPWLAGRVDHLKPLEERFPVLPPPHNPAPPQRLFQPTDYFKELTSDSTMRDEIDGFSVARTWYSYAQEPIPDPGEFPGFSKEATDRARQRRPRNITTLIFRGYPALTQTHRSDALQIEGWFDDTPWKVPGWFQSQGDRFTDGKPAEVAIPLEESAFKSWVDAYEMWRKHGESNLLLFRSFSDEVNKRSEAEKYWTMKNMPYGSLPPAPSNVDSRLTPRERERQTRQQLRDHIRSLPEDERPYYEAARYLYEYDFYRRLSNFPHHYQRAQVEAERDTVTARRKLYQAETYRLQGSPERALKAYYEPKDDKGPERGAIVDWRDKVLSVQDPSKHREYREDSYIQEQTFEVQLKYLDLVNEQYGRRMKQQVTDLCALMQQAGQLNRTAGDFVMPSAYSLALINYQHPPTPGSFSMFKGPFDIEVRDSKFTPDQTGQLLGLLTTPGGGPLVAGTTVAVGKFQPLIGPATVVTVLSRKNLLPRTKPPEETPKKAAK